ncbi:phosphotransferase [Patescibacteria group bacterium]
MTKKDRLKNIAWITKLAKAKNWQVKKKGLEKAVFKPNPRFAYFPLVNADGKKEFFKSCLYGNEDLTSRLRRELLVIKWFLSRNGPVRKITDSGQADGLLWYTAPYLSGQNWRNCVEEDVSPLSQKDAALLAKKIIWLGEIKKTQIPPKLQKALRLPFGTKEEYAKTGQEINRHLKVLKTASKVPATGWTPQLSQTIKDFWNQNKPQIAGAKTSGVLVHNDLAPNNIFFSDQKIIILDWEGAYWSSNRILNGALDLAFFYCRCWQKEILGKYLLKKISLSKIGKRIDFRLSLKIGFVLAILRKMAPMFEAGFYKNKLDQANFAFMIKTLKSLEL